MLPPVFFLALGPRSDYQVGLPADPPFKFYFQKQAGIPMVPFELEVSYPGGIAERKANLVKDTEVSIPW